MDQCQSVNCAWVQDKEVWKGEAFKTFIGIDISAASNHVIMFLISHVCSIIKLILSNEGNDRRHDFLFVSNKSLKSTFVVSSLSFQRSNTAI
jgi:hypothetical protein